MKKMLLGLMLSATLLGGTTVTANADTTGTPENTQGTVEFTGGDLTLDATTAGLDFGTNPISNKTETYANTNETAAVTVTDLRGTGDGWNLSVTQGKQFAIKDKSAQNLEGAVLTLNGAMDSDSENQPTLNSSVALTPGTSSALMGAESGYGLGTSKVVYATSNLEVPNTATKIAGTPYETTLTWDLGATPANN